jgi:hypothetical protein
MTIENEPYDPHGKSAAEIEHDIGETRAELGAVLDALERRLQPRHLLELGMDKLRDKMDENGGLIGDTLRNHPVPLALIGAGIGWLVVANFAGDRPAQLARDVGGRLSDAARQVGDKTRALADGMFGQDSGEGPEMAQDLYGAGEEMAGYAYARTKPRVAAGAAAAVETANRARVRVSRAIVEDPLVLGVIGLFAGLALALVLPRSGAEERLIGPVRERMRARAGEMGRAAVDRAQDVADRAVDTVKDAIKPAEG